MNNRMPLEIPDIVIRNIHFDGDVRETAYDLYHAIMDAAAQGHCGELMGYIDFIDIPVIHPGANTISAFVGLVDRTRHHKIVPCLNGMLFRSRPTSWTLVNHPPSRASVTPENATMKIDEFGVQTFNIRATQRPKTRPKSNQPPSNRSPTASNLQTSASVYSQTSGLNTARNQQRPNQNTLQATLQSMATFVERAESVPPVAAFLRGEITASQLGREIIANPPPSRTRSASADSDQPELKRKRY